MMYKPGPKYSIPDDGMALPDLAREQRDQREMTRADLDYLYQLDHSLFLLWAQTYNRFGPHPLPESLDKARQEVAQRITLCRQYLRGQVR